MINWKRLCIITLASLVLILAANIAGHVAFNDVADIAEEAIAKTVEYGQLVTQQVEQLRVAEQTIATQRATIEAYEKILFNKVAETAYNRHEAMEFITWCISTHEYYYDPARCNEYTGYPDHHINVNARYSKLLEYVRIK